MEAGILAALAKSMIVLSCSTGLSLSASDIVIAGLRPNLIMGLFPNSRLGTTWHMKEIKTWWNSFAISLSFCGSVILVQAGGGCQAG